MATTDRGRPAGFGCADRLGKGGRAALQRTDTWSRARRRLAGRSRETPAGQPPRLAPPGREVAVVAVVRAQGEAHRRGARRGARRRWRIEFVREVAATGRSVVRRYRFEPQDHEFDRGDDSVDQTTGKAAGTVVAIDDTRGEIDLKRGAKADWPHPRALIPSKPLQSLAMRQSLLRTADIVIANGFDPPGPREAVRDLIRRLAPRFVAGPAPAGVPLVRIGEQTTDAARRLGLELDGGVLPIQGPPGTGKTYSAARMVVSLVRAGRKVAIAAQSHKTISNLLEEIVNAGMQDSVPIRAIQKAGEDDAFLDHPDVLRSDDIPAIAHSVAAGPWTWWPGLPGCCRDRSSTRHSTFCSWTKPARCRSANAVAMGSCARSMVLVGDPNQLPMVSQGVHPAGPEASCLEHLVGHDTTVAPDSGLFLSTTRRLHPPSTHSSRRRSTTAALTRIRTPRSAWSVAVTRCCLVQASGGCRSARGQRPALPTGG